jgi:hypothetical protein
MSHLQYTLKFVGWLYVIRVILCHLGGKLAAGGFFLLKSLYLFTFERFLVSLPAPQLFAECGASTSHLEFCLWN